MWNYFEKRDELARVESKIEALKSRNATLQRKIDHLSDEQIDLDLLDEVSRDVLGTSGDRDEIIILPNKR